MMAGVSLVTTQAERSAYARSVLSWVGVDCARWLAMNALTKNAIVERFYLSGRMNVDHATRALVVLSTDDFCRRALVRPAGDVAQPSKSWLDVLNTFIQSGVGLATTVYNGENATTQQKIRQDFETKLAENTQQLNATNDPNQQAALANQNAAIQQLLASLQKPAGLSTGATVAIAAGAAVAVGAVVYLATRRRHNPVVRIGRRKVYLSARHARSRRASHRR